MIIYKNPTTATEVIVFVWTKYYTIAYFMSLAFSFNTASYCGSLVR